MLLLEAGPDDSTYPDVVRRAVSSEYDAILSAAVGVQWGVPVGAASSPTLFYRGEVLGGTPP
ncbi:MAG: hypothetical protein R2690_20215 [Acidimicrobiales bacterium]